MDFQCNLDVCMDPFRSSIGRVLPVYNGIYPYSGPRLPTAPLGIQPVTFGTDVQCLYEPEARHQPAYIIAQQALRPAQGINYCCESDCRQAMLWEARPVQQEFTILPDSSVDRFMMRRMEWTGSPTIPYFRAGFVDWDRSLDNCLNPLYSGIKREYPSDQEPGKNLRFSCCSFKTLPL